MIVSATTDGTMKLWDPEPPALEPSESLTDALCDAFGARIDQDSWSLVEGEKKMDSPCPSPETPEPPPLKLPPLDGHGAPIS